MRNVEIVESEGPLSALVAEVEGGQEVMLTRGGKAVARIVRENPSVIVVTPEQRARGLQALQELKELSKSLNLGPFDLADFKAARDEGRP